MCHVQKQFLQCPPFVKLTEACRIISHRFRKTIVRRLHSWGLECVILGTVRMVTYDGQYKFENLPDFASFVFIPNPFPCDPWERKASGCDGCILNLSLSIFVCGVEWSRAHLGITSGGLEGNNKGTGDQIQASQLCARHTSYPLYSPVHLKSSRRRDWEKLGYFVHQVQHLPLSLARGHSCIMLVTENWNYLNSSLNSAV